MMRDDRQSPGRQHRTGPAHDRQLRPHCKGFGSDVTFFSTGFSPLKPARMLGGVALLALAALAAPLAWAQDAQGDAAQPASSGAAGLDIPADVIVFGRNDPTLRKPTAIVNGDIITRTDIEQRLALIVAANGAANVPPEELERLRAQVLRNLIDETLQIQEAAGNEIKVAQSEIQQSYERVATNFKRNPQQMTEYLASIGSSEGSIKRQIEGELAWSRLLRRRVEPFVNVGQEEVQSIMARLEAAKGAQEVRVGEIFLSATPETAQDVALNARRIIEQIRQGGSFAAYARQFSEASTAAVGGDLGWLRPEQLPDALADAARGMQIGTLAGPIQIPGGFSILYMTDKRQVLTADPRDALLSLRQLAIRFPDGLSESQAAARTAEFATATRAIQGCGAAQEVAQKLGAEVVDNDQIKVRDLPLQLQELMINLQIGQATPPFGSRTDGVRVLVLCGRDEAESAQAPSFDRIMAQLEEQRVNLRARRYLRDLRRDAIIDYR
jgi:peptidyl-prolyl cis-trans isomerase SurA